MVKTTISEIKHLIHKNKSNTEENNSKKEHSESTKLSSDEQPASTALPSKDTNVDITFQNFSIHQSPISSEIEEKLQKVEGFFTIKELSRQFNVPASTLYYWAKKNHYRPKNGTIPSPISDELQEKILGQLRTKSIAELAKENSISYHKLYYWIKKQGLTAKNTSEFPIHIQQELREKCQTSSLRDLAREYGLSEQTMRSRLKNIGCFSDGKGGFLIVNNLIGEEILSCYQKNGILETAQKFHTTKTAIQSYLKKYNHPP